jgi:endoglucanase
VVHLAGPGMSAYKTGEYFKKPANVTNPWILQFHVYNPCEYTRFDGPECND